MEDVAIEILGKDMVNAVISRFPNSHVLMYHLGKNPQEAERLINLASVDGTQATIEFANLAKDLQVRPKSKPIPEPDEELAGGVVPKPSADKMYNKLLDQAHKTGDMKPLLDYQREQRALQKQR